MVLHLGNTRPVENPEGASIEPGSQTREANEVTTIILDKNLSLNDAVNEVQAVWQMHSAAVPAWVTGDNESLVDTLAEVYDCPTERPEDWNEN